MPLVLVSTEVFEAKVKATVQKTGKSYYRTMNYAKHVANRSGGIMIHGYFLRQGRGWREVTEQEFKEATSEEAVARLHEQLNRELRRRVEGDMKK
uniref:Uncharacterized protein n=1 Tax=viral metagenome TaxID=1070528 RepID=A0A6M3X5K9_9ZZZZ